MIRNRVSLVTFASFLLALSLGATTNAQYLISTKAGFVNRVEGKVYILRADSEDGEKGRASLGTQMNEGDKLSSTSKSFAETLLNPGSYLRLNENTEIRAASIDFNSVRFELIKGSVIAEIGEVASATPIEIITPHGALTIAKSGLHRIDVKESMTLVAVRQGEIHLGTRDALAANNASKIGRGKVVTLTGKERLGKSDIAKLDKDTADNFDTWSFNRAQSLTAANISALRRSRSITAFSGGWYYDSFCNCYTFMPFGSSFWSPYGFGFFNNYRNCTWYNPYYGGGYYGGGGYTRLPPRAVAGNDRGAISRGTDSRTIYTSPRSDSGIGDFGSSRGGGSVSTSSSSSSSVISAPAPSRSDSGGGGGSRSMPGRP
ncbi:MAG TPA: FecR domain-containing protein [Blastocatellia bacterium]|nr:FecR domain-containing protein [Blastocatellia bacterium]